MQVIYRWMGAAARVEDGVLKAWRGGSRSGMRQEDWVMRSGTEKFVSHMMGKSYRRPCEAYGDE